MTVSNVGKVSDFSADKDIMIGIQAMKLLFVVLLTRNIRICKSQRIDFVLVVEGRRYGLADKFSNFFKDVEDANKP